MPISLGQPKPPGQAGLRRPQGDGNLWTFRIVPQENIRWVEGPNWSYPGKGLGTDPAWGQWGGGDGQLWLSWISPQKASPFAVKVTGKILSVGGEGGGGGGEIVPIDVEADWEGEVFGVTQIYSDPNVDPEIMSGAMDDEDHTIVIYAKIGKPVAGVTVRFEVEDHSPSTTAASLSVADVVTDADGIAQTVLKSSNTDEEDQSVTVKVYVRDGDKSDLKQTSVALLIPGIEYFTPQ